LYYIFHAKPFEGGLMPGARGVTGWGVHLPYRRLDRAAIAAVAGTGGGTGTRTVACYDEDTTTMGAEAARAAVRAGRGSPAALWFATTTPAYADKTNATVLHAVLRLDRAVPAYDAVGSVRSALAALRAGWQGQGTALVVASDARTGRPGSADEAAGADAAAALLIGGDGDGDGPVLAEIIAWESLTEEFVDRWKAPGAAVSKLWEERFGETRYARLGSEALKLALDAAGISANAVDHLIVTGLHDRAVAGVQRQSAVAASAVADRLALTVGNPGAAQPALLLAATLEKAGPGEWIVLLSLADGADAVVLRTTPALAGYQPRRPVAAQVAVGGPISYGRYLHWRGFLDVEPPRRPEPARVSSPAAQRNAEWKYAFVASASGSPGSSCSGSGSGSGPGPGPVSGSPGHGAVHLPPSPLDDLRIPAADTLATIVTFTVDKLSYSLSPPVVFAIVDFDGGGRLPIELTDADAAEVVIGGRVEMTFRRLSTADAIHNYFWKARPVRGASREA
jgi:hydroxymethylglutaryl-CoA synthase